MYQLKKSMSTESEGWAKMSIRKKMKEEVDNFIETDDAKKHGLTNSTQFMDIAIREALEKYKKKRFEHFNFTDNVIRLIDNHKPQGTPYIEVALKGKNLVCRSCESLNCIHIDEAWKNEGISKQMKTKGLKENIN